MAGLEQWITPLVVVGLLLATLFLAAIAKRYQAYQARVRALVRRHATVIAQVEDALSALVAVPLSQALRTVLRGEVLARYQKIRVVYRRYPDLARRLTQAESNVAAEGPSVSTDVGKIDSEQAFRRLLHALDDLRDLFAHGDSVQAVPRDVRSRFVRELGERRAELASRFHLVEARKAETEDRIGQARAHITTLMQVLRSRGPSTDFVRELYHEAETALFTLNQPPAAAQPADAEGDGGSATAAPGRG